MGEPEVVGPIAAKWNRNDNLKPIRPGEVRNPNGTSGIVAFARHLKSLGLADKCGEVLLQCLSSPDETIQLQAAALSLRYIFGVPQKEINDGESARRLQFDPSKLSPEQLAQLENFLRLMTHGS